MKSAVKSINDIHSEICNKICSKICNEFNELLQNSVAFSKILLDFMKSFVTSGLSINPVAFSKIVLDYMELC